MPLQLVNHRANTTNFGQEKIDGAIPETKNWWDSLKISNGGETVFDRSVSIYTAEKFILNELKSPEEAMAYLSTTKIKEIYHSIENIRVLIRIKRAFSKYDQNRLPRAKFKEILNMPLVPDEEISGDANVNPRNILFELEMAARFIESGFHVVGFDDIEFILNGTRIIAECKRLHSTRNIKENCRKAHDQIHKRFQSINDRGLVILAYDKTVTNLGDTIFNVDSEKQLIARGEKLFNEFYEENKKYFKVFKKARIVGLMCAIRFTYIYNDEYLLSPMGNYQFINTYNEGLMHNSSDGELYDIIYNTMDMS